MLEAVRALCAERAVARPARARVRDGVRLRRLLRLRGPDARRAIVRLCVDGPVLDAAALETRDRRRSGALTALQPSSSAASSSPTRSSTPRGRSTRSPPGGRSATSCCEQFPFAAFVSKTVTLAPARGQPAAAPVGARPAGMINSIGLPNKGLEGYLRTDLPQLARAAGAADRQRDGLQPRGGRPSSSARSPSATRWRRSSSTSPAPTSRPGLMMGADPDEVSALLDHVRPLTDKPLIVKLTPNATDVPAVARAAEESRGRRGVADQHDPRDGAGPALGRALARAAPPAACRDRRSERSRWHRFTRWRNASRSRSSAMGGVQSGQDALDLMRAGATWSPSGRRASAIAAAGARVAGELAGLAANSARLSLSASGYQRRVANST